MLVPMRRTSPPARISSISACRSDSRLSRGPPFAAAASTAWAMYALRASPARLAAASMTAYSSPVSVISTRRVRGTGCRARRRPCSLTPAWLPSLVARVILSCSRSRRLFRDRLCFTSADFPGWEAYRWPRPVPVYVWTAPGPYVSGGLFHILLTVVPGRFHSAQETLVSDRASVLLAAGAAVASARREARSSPG